MKKIIFITATRADYGKLKTIIFSVQNSKKFKAHVFVTGMHNMKEYGNTYELIQADKIKNITNYFSFKELSTPLADVKVSNYSGWSGLEVFKFFIPISFIDFDKLRYLLVIGSPTSPPKITIESFASKYFSIKAVSRKSNCTKFSILFSICGFFI